MTTYRNDHDAALARIDALEAENAALREERARAVREAPHARTHARVGTHDALSNPKTHAHHATARQRSESRAATDSAVVLALFLFVLTIAVLSRALGS